MYEEGGRRMDLAGQDDRVVDDVPHELYDRREGEGRRAGQPARKGSFKYEREARFQ